jgi:hypothetical protein
MNKNKNCFQKDESQIKRAKDREMLQINTAREKIEQNDDERYAIELKQH